MAVGRHPEIELPFRHQPPRYHAIDPDAFGVGAHPADRAEIDDRAAAGRAHLRRHRLRREELVPQIDLHAILPVVDGDVRDLVAIVIGGVVDEHTDRSVLLPDAGDCRLERGNDPEVGVNEPRRRMPPAGDAGRQGLR